MRREASLACWTRKISSRATSKTRSRRAKGCATGKWGSWACGPGQLCRETRTPPTSTGEGLAMGYRAGAELRDLEFMQFHPTVLYIAGSARHLITEAVRGEGAYLRDRTGRRFMPDYDSRAELASRDVVARAIAEQMAKTQHPNVHLDLTHLDSAGVRSRFPGIDRVCRQFGLDITR